MSSAAYMEPPTDIGSPEIGAARFALSSRLVDSMLHDVRNPLNAMAIHLDVLTEKLKVEGKVPAGQEKNLKAIRDQIFRIDGLLRQYADFLSNKSHGDASLSDIVQRAAVVVGHELRKSQLTLRQAVEPEVRITGRDTPPVAFFVAQALLRAVGRSPAGTEVELVLVREGARAILRVRDSGESAADAGDASLRALRAIAQELGAELSVTAGELTASFSSP